MKKNHKGNVVQDNVLSLQYLPGEQNWMLAPEELRNDLSFLTQHYHAVTLGLNIEVHTSHFLFYISILFFCLFVLNKVSLWYTHRLGLELVTLLLT